MCQICRTCLEIVEDGVEFFAIDTIKPDPDLTCIKSKLESCIPEIRLDIVKNSIICNRCSTALSVAYEFRTKCLQTEETIYSFMLHSSSNYDTIDLRRIVVKELNCNGTAESQICNVDAPGCFEQCYTAGLPDVASTIKTEDPLKLEKGDAEESDVENKINPFKCSICERCYKYEATMKRHMENHSVQDTYYICYPDNFGDSLRLEKHGKLSGDEKRFKCGMCGYFSNKSLKLHMKVHTEERLLKCDDCDYSTVYKKHLNIHMNQAHSGIRPFKCPSCDYSGANKSHLTRHMTIHTGEKPFKCTICDFSTAYKNNLRDHISIHAGYKPYKCARCEFSTTTKHHLSKHIKIHTDDRPYKCTICGFSTIYQSSLKKHSSVHIGSKPYKCSECNYSTTSKGRLNEHHADIHLGSRPYKCDKCEYSTARKGNYKHHMKLHSLRKQKILRLDNSPENDPE